MSDTSKRWVGIAVASLAAAGLAATELVDTPNEWAGLDESDFAAADVAAGRPGSEYEAAAADLSAGIDSSDEFLDAFSNPFSNPFSEELDLGSHAVGAAPGAAYSATEVLPISRLTVDLDGHFALTASAADVFDSYYRSYSSSSDEVVRGRIVLALLDGLPPRAADEAISALDEWRAARELGSE